MTGTAEKLIAETASLIVNRGYNGFSYADLAERFGIRKASIHHHFPSKADLVVAVVERGRAGIQAQIALLDDDAATAMDRLLAYTGYWERCILDQTSPFCLAGVLAAELPALPEEIGTVVRGHFDDLRRWVEGVLRRGAAEGSMTLEERPAVEAEIFVAAVYGAMLVARAFDDPTRFSVVVEAAIRRIKAFPRH